jgi:hypothetical protein
MEAQVTAVETLLEQLAPPQKARHLLLLSDAVSYPRGHSSRIVSLLHNVSNLTPHHIDLHHRLLETTASVKLVVGKRWRLMLAVLWVLLRWKELDIVHSKETSQQQVPYLNIRRK